MLIHRPWRLSIYNTQTIIYNYAIYMTYNNRYAKIISAYQVKYILNKGEKTAISGWSPNASKCYAKIVF